MAAFAYLLLSAFLALFPLASSIYFRLRFAAGLASPLLFAAPAAAIAVFLLFRLKGRKRKELLPEGVVSSLRNLELMFLLLVIIANDQVIAILAGNERTPLAFLLLFSAALAYLGWCVQSAPENPALGFRFPWIKGNEDAWAGTQKAGALGLYFSALFPPIAAIIPPAFAMPIVVIPIAVSLAATVAYSTRFIGRKGKQSRSPAKKKKKRG